MAKLQIAKGSTNVTLLVFIQDDSSYKGEGLTGLVFNSSGLTCYYARPGATPTSLTLATQTVTGAHSDGGFVELDSTNMPGWYRLDLSDAIVATGVDSVGIHLQGAVNMIPLPLEVQLTDITLSNINNEVLDVVNVDTFAEPGGVPAATATLIDMIHWLYTLSRNKGTQTSTTKTLRNDADTGNIATATISNTGGTFTRNEYT